MEQAVLGFFGFLAEHGYLVVFLWMFADQAGLPLPALPLLVAAGAVAAGGALDPGLVILVATIATVLADALWYVAGRVGGAHAVHLVCRIALEPTTCITATRDAFARYGAFTLVIAKFLPGVQTLAPASAGYVRAPWPGVLLLDLIGTLLFVVPLVVGGYAFREPLLAFLIAAGDLTSGAGLALMTLIVFYLAWKIAQWLTFLRGHRLRRVTAVSLFERIENDDRPVVIDLRQRFDYAEDPRAIPGALRIPIDQVPRRRHEIPPARDVVLVCT
jgi:membrane protein DedA with SNARE-associated domain